VPESAVSADNHSDLFAGGSRCWAAREPRNWLKDCAGQACDEIWGGVQLCWQDYRHYYSCDNLLLLAAGVAVAAPFANTSADGEIQQWYQGKVRAASTDPFFDAVKYSGDHWALVSISLGAILTGTAVGDFAPGSAVSEWGSRSLRALIVGGPPVGILQMSLGASRPGEGNSHWQPFQDTNAVSGHAFVGAVPFLTAAAMTENRFCRYSLAAVSVLPVWSRINDDGHYFSQALLGWWMAYLAVRSVNQTERERTIHVLPACEGADGPGVSLMLRY
jgi:hypothetical protein